MRRQALSCIAIFVLCGCIAPPPAEVPRADAQPNKADAEPQARVLWSAQALEEIYEPGEVREFEILQGGRRIGRSWGRYVGEVEGEAGHHRFETRIELNLPGRDAIRSQGELVLDADGELVRGYERSVAAQIEFERNGDAVMLDDGQRVDEVDYRPQREAVAVMAHSAILHEELMLATRELAEGIASWRLVSLSGGPPVEWEAEVIDDGGRVRLQTSLGESIVFDGGRIESIEVRASDMEIKPMAEPAWPQWSVDGPRKLVYTPPSDARFTIRPVELPGRADEPALAGEVLVPKDATAQKLVPGVVWISGTGQEDRYGFAGPPPVDLGSHAVTDALAQAGLAVIRFDDRGEGRSEPGPQTFLGQVEDARRALRTLLVQDEVDPDRIVVIGHGEGGLRALHVANGRADSIVGVALLATPGRPYREVFFHQAEMGLQRLPPDLRKDARRQQVEMLDAIIAGGEIPRELEPQAQWIREILAQKPEALLAASPGHLFIAQGGKDFEIDPDADLQALVRAAKKHKKPHTVKTYPELDHLFKHEPQTSTPERYLQTDRPIAEPFITDLVKWAQRVTKPR